MRNARATVTVKVAGFGKFNGAIIYRGPSMIDGRAIVAIATGLSKRSRNPKTGDMVQVFILVDGVSPVEAARQGLDISVCGGCRHRKVNGDTCYVTLIHGPRAVYQSLQRGAYPVVSVDDLPALGAGHTIRLGAYGDPMAVPAAIWSALLSNAIGHTGYTHQWADERIDADQRRAVLSLVMASVDSESEALDARQRGYRYFRVRPTVAPLSTLPREIVCPASEEAGYRRTCDTCKACSGGAATRASVVINVHGNGTKRFNLQVVS